jgi:integrase
VSNNPDRSRVPSLSFYHASAQEWETFVRRFATSKKYQAALLLYRRQFVVWYPDLEEWFAAPLVERVGRSDEECRQNVGHHDVQYRASYHARHYLAFLALCGYARFDWDWLIAVRQFRPASLFTCAAGDMGMTHLLDDAFHLGTASQHTTSAFHWLIHRILMHTGVPDIEQITDVELQEFEQALDCFAERPDVDALYGSVDEYRKRLKSRKISLHQLQLVLYHRGQVNREPQRVVNAPSRRVFMVHKPRMQEILARYLTARSLTDEPATVKRLDLVMREFVDWIEQTYPETQTFAEVTREHVLEYAEALNTRLGMFTSQPLALSSKRLIMTKVAQFFREVSYWGWEDVPPRPLLLPGELPKRPLRIPRYIPEPELERLMGAIRALDCPYQQAALLIARWSGARRGEIRRLEVDCLDNYPDGTPRLRIPAGKTYQERVIPIHEEAAAAIRTLQARHCGERGLVDRKTGIITRYLFMHRGRLFGARYLFECAIEKACQAASLVTPDGKPTVTPHRFRHTVGTQLAQRGARLRTIQKILGHESAAMSLAYLGISEEDVRQDYQAVLGEQATIAGPGAELLRSGHLTQLEVTWLKDHYFQTELELGRCLRLPQEGPCECDLYLTCAKFVTTPAYAPRLRRRRRIEQELVEDAAIHGWPREVERHQCTIRRLEQLLTDLREPIEGPEAPD